MAGRGFFGEALLVKGAQGLAVGVGERAAVGSFSKGKQLLDSALGLEAVFAEDGDFFGTATGFFDGAVDFDFADADVGQFAFAQDVSAADERGGNLVLGELVFVALVDFDDGGAGLVGAVREDEARGLADLKPDTELQAGGTVVRHGFAGEQGLNGLGIVDVTLGDVARHDA